MSEAEATAERPGRRAYWTGAFWAFAHLAVLSTFALAQPLFDLLGDNPEFFAARGSPGGDIVSFALAAVLLPPLVLLAVELLAGLADARARRALHVLFIALGVALIAVQALKKSIDASDALLIALAVLLGLAAGALYWRAEGVRQFMNVLSPAPVLFLVIFLFFSPVTKLVFPAAANAQSVGGVTRTPVVMLMFDELPLLSLLDDRGRIDSDRFPGFASLARGSTWFRNAYTVYDSTERALPAILDGDYPRESRLPTASDHPNSVFALLGKTHQMNASEESTSICPRDLCRDVRLDEPYPDRMRSLSSDLGLVWLHVVSPPGIERDLPSVSDTWGDFGGGGGAAGAGGDAESEADTRANLNRNRNKRLSAWIDSVRPTRRPTLNFKDVLLPHVPWQYLPSGRQYRRSARDAIPQLSRESYKDPTQVASAWQRHLLQVGFVDRAVGRLVARLKRDGLWKRALVVVAADHGIAFDPGVRDRRKITSRNAAEIAPIPLFIRAPGQGRGRVDDSYVESVDILPTIVQLLGIRPRARMDGRPASSAEVRRRRSVRIFERGSFKPLRFSAADWQRRRAAALQRKVALFGVGREGPLRLFRVGPREDLLFRPLRAFRVVPGSGATLVGAGEYRRVDLRGTTVPAQVAGHLKGVPAGRVLAVAVNQRIAATTRSFELAIGGGPIFSVMTPESFWRQGRNRVEVFEVQPGNVLRRLASS